MASSIVRCNDVVYNPDDLEGVRGNLGYSGRLTLEQWEVGTPRGVAISQNVLITYTAGITFTASINVYSKFASLECPGLWVDITFTFRDISDVNIGTSTKTVQYAGCTLTKDDLGNTTDVQGMWTNVAHSDTCPAGTHSIDLEFFFYQKEILLLEKAYVDAIEGETKNPISYVDTYAMFDRELLGIQGITVGEFGSYLMGATRHKLGTLAAKHDHKQEGKLVKVCGGSDKDSGHPMNVLLRLLMTRKTGVNLYDPATHKYDKGDGYGLGFSKYDDTPDDDSTNTVVDVAAIEAVREATPGLLCEFRLTQGIGTSNTSNFKDWVEEQIMRPFGMRWSPGKDGKISVTRLDNCFLDQERRGTMASGIFTPDAAPGWYANCWQKTPALYLWVKDTNQTYVISSNTSSTITVASPPPDGVYVCAVLPKAAVQPSPSAVGYPYVAVIGTRDMEGLPLIDYNTEVINRISWKFDYDPSNTVDSRHTTKHLSLVDYDEGSFWGDTFHDGPNSSFSRYEDQNLDYNSQGLRGVGASKFANGYNLNGNKVARMTSYDCLRRWREQVPRIKFTVGIKFVYLEAGDIIRVQHSLVRDYRNGLVGLDKIMQITTVRYEYANKKMTIEGYSLSDVLSPPLMPPITFPTIYQHYMNIRHPPLNVIENLKVHDYPFHVSNLFFVRQTYGAIDAVDAKHRKWKEGPLGLVVPDFPGYRHTNVYVSSDNITYRKIAETNEPFVFFAWEADNDQGFADPLYVKFSYSSNSYDPVTGEYQESALCPNTAADSVAIEPYPSGKQGVDLGVRNEASAQMQMAERLNKGRLYSKLGNGVD